MLCGSIVKRSTGGDEFVLGSGWWEIAIGSKASIEASVGGDYAKEEYEECWLGIMVFSFRRMTSSLESMEALVAAKRS